MGKLKVIIFDFDGVIADTLPFTFKKITEISKKLRIKKLSDKEFIKSLRTKTSYQLFKEMGENISWLKLPLILFLIKKAQEELYRQIGTIKVFPGVKRLLLNLKKKGYQMVLVSSNLEKNVKKFLEKNNLAQFFQAIDCGSHLLGKDKVLKGFLKKNSLANNQVVYIGDEIRDVEACQKAKIPIITASWGLGEAQALKKSGADFLVQRPEEILPIIDGW